MAKGHRSGKGSNSDKDLTLDSRFQVYGMNVLVKIVAEPGPDRQVHCPKGDHILYGQVIARGDGYDPDPNSFRPMPPLGTLIVFEEGSENVEGHSVYVGGQEYRIIHGDSIIVGMPEPEA
jgi:hypothetical protein